MPAEYDCIDDDDERPCPYCKGGYQTIELDGGGPAYACPDCCEDEED